MRIEEPAEEPVSVCPGRRFDRRVDVASLTRVVRVGIRASASPTLAIPFPARLSCRMAARTRRALRVYGEQRVRTRRVGFGVGVITSLRLGA